MPKSRLRGVSASETLKLFFFFSLFVLSLRLATGSRCSVDRGKKNEKIAEVKCMLVDEYKLNSKEHAMATAAPQTCVADEAKTRREACDASDRDVVILPSSASLSHLLHLFT